MDCFAPLAVTVTRMASEQLTLLAPSLALLPGYVAALRTGWSPNTTQNVSTEQLAAIDQDAEAFLTRLCAQGGTVILPDGSTRERLPWLPRWMWDGEFCGAINLRWPADLGSLPPHVSGHVGYSVVPWKRGKGYATQALRLMLSEARRVGLRRVEITTDEDNLASQRVIEKAGGAFVGVRPPDQVIATVKKLYVVELAS